VTCREMVEFLMAWLDGELPEDQRAAFEQHLALCPPCEVYLETYKEAVRLGRKVCHDEDRDAVAEAPDELVQAILAARGRPGA